MKSIDTNFTFSILSQYRTELFGLSALLIVFFHFHVWQIIPEYTKYIFRFAFGGVDIFLFLSGIGLCYSIEKNSAIKSFYLKRFLRIYPSFAQATAIGLFAGRYTIATAVLMFTGLTYWMAPFISVREGFWYIALIIPLYVAFPFVYRLLNKLSIKKCITIFAGLLILPYIVHFSFGEHYDYALTRIMPFMLGCFLFVKRNKLHNIGMPLIISSILLFVVLNTYSLLSGGANILKTLVQLSMLGLIAPGFSLLFALFLSHCNIFILRFLNWLGTMSLELYLVHLTLYYWIKNPFILLAISIVTSYIIMIVSNNVRKWL